MFYLVTIAAQSDLRLMNLISNGWEKLSQTGAGGLAYAMAVLYIFLVFSKCSILK